MSQNSIAARIAILIHLYFVFIAGWLVLRIVFGDAWGWLFLLNAFAPYWFIPLPFLFALALVARRRAAWTELGAVAALAIFLYGGLFVPRLAPAVSRAETLTVLTYNVLDLGVASPNVVTTIRQANADIVAIQELNPPTARLIARELAREYPYQLLNPQTNTRGMGLISRMPMRATGESLAGEWVGVPQIASVTWGDRTITVINAHPAPTNFAPRDYFFAAEQVEASIRERERDIQVIANSAINRITPTIVLGDFNTPEQSMGYDILARNLVDAWRARGWGLGHTFPAPNERGESRLAIVGIGIPTWLVRIDYVFHSRDWETVSAQIGPWDGVSDHRPVVATLKLRK